MAAPEQVQLIDVDQLAKDKVQEIEDRLDETATHKLETIETWLNLLRQIITAADLHRTIDKNDKQDSIQSKSETGDSIYAYYTDDDEQIHAADPTEQFATYSVKWTIRVKAFKLVHRIVNILNQTARTTQANTPLIKHLSDLIRLSFVAATSPYDDLKLQGFEMFRLLVAVFATVEERQIPGHSILEQYKVQLISALRPAFEPDSPPYITAIASRICSLWICLGLEKDPVELQRIFDSMMMMTIAKLENQSINQNSKLYTESELEQERLDILCAWAQLYHTSCHSAIHSDNNVYPSSIDKSNHKLLLQLVEPQLPALVDKWWEALKDYALLILPTPKNIGLNHDSEHVYTKEVALKLFTKVWSEIMLAGTLWLTSNSNSHVSAPLEQENGSSNVCSRLVKKPELDRKKYYQFISGLIMKEFCSSRINCPEELPETTLYAIWSLKTLIHQDDFRSLITEDLEMSREFYFTVYRILLTGTKFRSKQYSSLKSLLDSIFNLIVIKINSIPEAKIFGIAFLLDKLKEEIMVMPSASQDLEEGYALSQISISTRICNILVLVKHGCLDNLDSSSDIFLGLLETFQLVASICLRIKLGTSFFEYVKELYQLLQSDCRQKAILALFGSKKRIFLDHVVLYTSEASIEKSQIQPFKFIYEALFKYLKHDIDLSIADDKSELLNDLVTALLKFCPKSLDELENAKPCVHEVTHMNLKFLEELSRSYEDIFDDSLVGDTSMIYKSVLLVQEEQKTKRNAKLASRDTTKVPINNVKRPTKIVLKADFSNFYGKK